MQGIGSGRGGNVFDIFNGIALPAVDSDSGIVTLMKCDIDRFGRCTVIDTVTVSVAAVDCIGTVIIRSDEKVIIRTAVECVITRLSIDSIVARIAVNLVAACIAAEGIGKIGTGNIFKIDNPVRTFTGLLHFMICQRECYTTLCMGKTDGIFTCTAIEHIVTAVAFYRIVMCRSCHIFNRTNRIESCIGTGILLQSTFEVETHPGLCRGKCNGIDPVTTVDQIISFASFEGIVTRTGKESVVSRFAFKQIIAVTAFDQIVAVSAFEMIVSGFSADRIITPFAVNIVTADISFQNIVLIISDDRVVLYRTDHILNTLQCISITSVDRDGTVPQRVEVYIDRGIEQ